MQQVRERETAASRTAKRLRGRVDTRMKRCELMSIGLHGSAALSLAGWSYRSCAASKRRHYYRGGPLAQAAPPFGCTNREPDHQSQWRPLLWQCRCLSRRAWPPVVHLMAESVLLLLCLQD